MKKTTAIPNQEAYEPLILAFDKINETLFNDELPPVLITLQRRPNTFGYFSKNRFMSNNNEYVHELAINPEMFSIYPIKEVLQTLAHEATHLWQEEFGTPSRKCYHNKQWADKMESIGLMPSDTGKEGGKKTGQHIADYIIENGDFDKLCNELLKTDFTIKWYDRFPPLRSGTFIAPDAFVAQISQQSNTTDPVASVIDDDTIKEYMEALGNTAEIKKPAQTRKKFSCPICKSNLWGKESLQVICAVCNVKFV